MVEDNGKGPVEKGAHFYRSLQIDAHGNPINKRNAWATRAVVYVRLIPPGAADTVHYRVHIPENAGNKITFHARLCYRKFSWYGTHEAFAGVPDPSKPDAVAPDYDDRPTLFTASLGGVSAKDRRRFRSCRLLPSPKTKLRRRRGSPRSRRQSPRRSRKRKSGSAGTITALACSCREI